MGSQRFKTLDESDANDFAKYLADDSSFTFGNAEPVKGKGPIRSYVVGFFSSIDGLFKMDHELIRECLIYIDNSALFGSGISSFLAFGLET